MSNDWSLSQLLENLHRGMENCLASGRGIAHSGTKGAASENAWLRLFETYLPSRYCSTSGHIVDSCGNFSKQIDIVVFDHQYSPFIMQHEEQIFLPAESVYAVFEVKQEISSRNILDAGEKIASVRRLHRTSLEIFHAGGKYPAKSPEQVPIYGGILAYDSHWKKPLELSPLRENLSRLTEEAQEYSRIDLGCVAKQGYFLFESDRGGHTIHSSGKATTAFLFKLIATLQVSGTVPRLDIEAYMKFL